MRPTTLAKAGCVCVLALTGFIAATLVTAPPAQSYSIIDLPDLGYSVLSDNKGNGCIAWSAGLPGFQRTLIGQDCWPTFQALLDNYIAQSLPALQAWQAQHAAAAAAVPTVTRTVMQTVYDSAGGTFTVTVTNPGVTVTAPPETVTAPPETTTETHTTYLLTPGPSVTVTREIVTPAPPPETVTETTTTTMTETQIVEHTRTITVTRPVAKTKRAARRRFFRTG